LRVSRQATGEKPCGRHDSRGIDGQAEDGRNKRDESGGGDRELHGWCRGKIEKQQRVW
jgi:hypothetical protein